MIHLHPKILPLIPLLILCLANPVEAKWHATLTMTTNNGDRWFTKSANHPALLANIDYQHDSGAYVGVNTGTINYKFNADDKAANVEITPYVGWSFELPKQWRADLQWSRYIFDGTVSGHTADYNEFYFFLHYRDLFSGQISGAENYYGLGNYALQYELTGRYPILEDLEFSCTFGYSQTRPALGSDYPYWNTGLTYYYKFAAFDLRYKDAAETAIDPIRHEKLHERYDPPLLGPTVVFSMSFGF